MTSQHSKHKRKILQVLLSTEISNLNMTIQGISMVPTLQPHDMVFTEKGPYLPGDILVFVRDEVMVVHRMVGWWHCKSKWFIVTKGDNLPNVDVLVPRESIIGKVTYWQRNDEIYTESLPRRLSKWLLNVGGYIVHRVTRSRLKTH